MYFSEECQSFHRLCPHWIELLSLVSSPKCIGAFAGSKVRLEGLKALRSLCHRTDGNNVEVLVAHFKNSYHQVMGSLAFQDKDYEGAAEYYEQMYAVAEKR